MPIGDGLMKTQGGCLNRGEPINPRAVALT